MKLLPDQILEILWSEPIAAGSSIRQENRLRTVYGPGRWRKMKGEARVRLRDGSIRTIELHWYEAHGIGRREFKIKTR